MATPSIVERYPPRATSPGVARRHIVEFLVEHHHGDMAPVASLLVSELITNAVRHAGGPIELRAMLGDGTLRIEVDDASQEMPMPRPPDVTGRGLHIVAATADDFGTIARDGRGKTIWTELRRH